MPLSVVINTKNAADTIMAALQSVRSIADELIVVDMRSSDTTVELARTLADRVLVLTEDYGYVEPARAAAIQACSHPWVFILDADETVTPALAREIGKLIEKTTPESPAAFRIPRQNFVFGSPLRHTGWWPDYQLRLFQRDKITWPAVIHTQPTIKGEVVTLPADESLALQHQNYTSVKEFLERLNRYTSIQAKDTKPALHTSLTQTFFDEWFRRLFRMHGYQDGVRGVGLSYLQGMYQLLVALKQREAAEWSEDQHEFIEMELETLRNLPRQIAYWLADWQVRRNTGWRAWYWRVRRLLCL